LTPQNLVGVLHAATICVDYLAGSFGAQRRRLVNYTPMRFPRLTCLLFLLLVGVAPRSFASAYNARPKLVIVIVIDQFRGDYLERYRDQFGEGGFRLLLDHGAYFTDCNYDYANTRTAPGHATLFSGAYSDGHGIMANEWWDPQKKKMVTSVQDDGTTIVGVAGTGPGASPHNLLADTLGDELKLATQGKARVFGVALKDRAAVLTAGFAGDGAYWIDQKAGAWITSTYYRHELPKWVADFNSSRTEKYWNQEWKDPSGKVLRTTAPRKNKNGEAASFYEIVGSTPLANDYEFEFARELTENEKLGSGPATDMLVVSLCANDILGHQVGPDSPEMQAMALAMDRQLADFFTFVGHQMGGLANVWLVLSADHGISPLPSVARAFHIPAEGLGNEKVRAQINGLLSTKLSPGHSSEFVKVLDFPIAWLDQDVFASLKISEEVAERSVGEAMEQSGMRDYFTRSQLAKGTGSASEMGRKYMHSYAPLAGWYVLGVPVPYTMGPTSGTDHTSPYTYDTHVPLAFYGIPFQPGTYRTHSEPVDMAVTLASLLGINAPTHAAGRVLVEALAPTRRTDSSSAPPVKTFPSANHPEQIRPASQVASEGSRP
jgi:arylsulfatase A-like enzyme